MEFLKRHFFTYLVLVIGTVTFVVFGANFYVASRSVTALAGSAFYRPTIVIDAGHGGEDGGAVSKSGVLESHLNLQIARRMEDLCHLCGLPTSMIRSEDVSVYSEDAKTVSEKKISDLKNRVKLVNQLDCALLLSIHQNMFSQSQYTGMQIFYAPTAGSRALAELLQQRVAQHLDPDNHRQAKPADSVYLMNEVHCTAILAECGFLSNPAECKKLQEEGYQKQISITILSSIVDYIQRANSDEI